MQGRTGKKISQRCGTERTIREPSRAFICCLPSTLERTHGVEVDLTGEVVSSSLSGVGFLEDVAIPSERSRRWWSGCAISMLCQSDYESAAIAFCGRQEYYSSDDTSTTRLVCTWYSLASTSQAPPVTRLGSQGTAPWSQTRPLRLPEKSDHTGLRDAREDSL